MLLLVRNICLDKNKKSVVVSKEGWLNFVLESCGNRDLGVMKAGLSCFWIFLYRSEKAVSVVKGNEELIGLFIESEEILGGIGLTEFGVSGMVEDEERDVKNECVVLMRYCQTLLSA